MKNSKRKVLAVCLCLVLTICLGTVCAIAATSGSVQLEDGGYHASGSSSISVGSASANTQGSDPNMQIYVSGQYEYYTDYQYKDSAHLATKNGNNSGAYHANISFDPGYNGVSKSLDSTHSFSCGYYNASKGIHVQYP